MNRTRKLGIGCLLVAAIALIGVFGPLIVAADPQAQDLNQRLGPAIWANGGTWAHPLGTDEFGRDVASRLVSGTRISLVIGLAAVILSAGVGTLAGLLAATGGRFAERTILQLIDAQSALPPILLAIVVAAVLGPSVVSTVIVLGVTGWNLFARVVYAQTLSLRERDYVTAAVAIGSGRFHILGWHILPNLMAALMVLTALQVGQTILMESALSFLGVGVPLTAPSWGGMLADARKQLWTAPSLTILPGIAIGVTVWSVNILGEGLKERFGARAGAGLG